MQHPSPNPESDPGPHPPSPGERAASAEIAPSLVAQLYDELREIARQQMSRERPGQTLQTTALVHEAYFRLGGKFPVAGNDAGESGNGARGGELQGTQRFFQAAAIAMRRILVDRARARNRIKRGGGVGRVSLEDAEQAVASNAFDDSVDWLALDDALTALEAQDKELAALVGLRYFAGLSVDQTAAALGVSPRTVDRNWLLARAFLQRRLLDSQTGE